MLHEFKTIVTEAKKAASRRLRTVFVSVVDLDGSSYRRPGVRMMISEDGTMVGAVSGGCVEKEILRQAQSVFDSGLPKLMMYDGRYRLGCEGILFILIEVFDPEPVFFDAFEEQRKLRKPFNVSTYFSKEEKFRFQGGSVFSFGDAEKFSISKDFDGSLCEDSSMQCFAQKVQPAFRLMIVGAEHDAVELCKYASLTGWEVSIVAPPEDSKSIINFPGAETFLSISEEGFGELSLDDQTAVVLMTHSFVKDLKYLSSLIDKKITYLGLLGPSRRREKLLSKLLEYHPDTADSFFEQLCGPSGLNIGAETPQEIAISIMAEILAVVRDQDPIPLKEKKGGIHQ